MGGGLLLIAETESGTPGGCLSNQRSFTDFTSRGRDLPLSCSATTLIAAYTLLPLIKHFGAGSSLFGI